MSGKQIASLVVSILLVGVFTFLIAWGLLNAAVEILFGSISGAIAVSKIGLGEKKKIDWKWFWKRKTKK